MNIKEFFIRVGLFIISIFIGIIIYETIVKWGVANFILINMDGTTGTIIMLFFRVSVVFFSYVLLLMSFKMKITKPVKYILWIAYLGTIFLLLFARKAQYNSINLSLHRVLRELHGRRSQIYFIGNILFFVPFGYLFRKLNFFIMVLIALCMEFTIETMQHITGRGVFDIGDIITNMTGILLGYIVVNLIRYIKKMVEKNQNYKRRVGRV